MRRLPLTAFLALAVLAPRAEAHVIAAFGQIRAGAASGRGIAGDQPDADFFAKTEGAAYGLLVGIEVMWIDAWIEHDQYTDGSRLLGTWTQFMVGLDTMVPFGAGPKEEPKWFANFGLGVGFGVGTGAQIEPPLDNAQISDKGFLAQVKVGVEYRFNDLLAMGVTVPVTYGYLFKNNVPANDTGNQYQSIHATGLLYLQVKLAIK